jgi:hypothetical protein
MQISMKRFALAIVAVGAQRSGYGGQLRQGLQGFLG